MMQFISSIFSLVFLLSACSKSGDGASSGSSAAAAYQTSAQICASGGTITDPKGTWTLIVPAGAVGENKTITVTTNAMATGTVPASYAAKTAMLDFSPAGLTFITPATLKVSYAQGDNG